MTSAKSVFIIFLQKLETWIIRNSSLYCLAQPTAQLCFCCSQLRKNRDPSFLVVIKDHTCNASSGHFENYAERNTPFKSLLFELSKCHATLLITFTAKSQFPKLFLVKNLYEDQMFWETNYYISLIFSVLF